MYTCNISKSYSKLNSIYINSDARKDDNFVSNQKVTVTLNNDSDFSVSGKLNANGYLSGMAKLYSVLKLKENVEVKYEIVSDGNLVIHEPALPPDDLEQSIDAKDSSDSQETVFQRKKLKHIHIEPFRPENLNTWEPETEADVYLVFGVLQQYTGYQYCCGTSTKLLDKLGAHYEGVSKPDAILIEDATDRYLIAEWKKDSASFTSNHSKEDIDILVCWNDNAKDKSSLPSKVLELHSIAKIAAETVFKDT